MTTWSEHAKHYILTSDFDAALISETHLERERNWCLLKKKRENSHGQARQCGDQHCKQRQKCGSTRTGPHTLVLQALVHMHQGSWFFCSNPPLAERVIRVMGREIVVYSSFRVLRRFPQRYQRQFDARRVFSYERRKASFHSGSGFQLPAKLVARPVHARRQSLASETGSISGHPRVNHTHVPCGQRSEARHHRELVVSRQHVLQGESTQHADSGDPAVWNEARRAFVSSKARSLAAKMVRKTRKLHAPNLLTRVASWRRLMSWATQWRPGATLRINTG